MDKDRAFKTLALTEVNRHILDAAHDSIADEQGWEFFCECGQAGCHDFVTLSPSAYAALRDGGEAVLAPGHSLSQAERARRLSDDARALRAQAEHQARRAKKNLGEP